jgi:hypothetical protein
MDATLEQSIAARREMLAQWRASRHHRLTLPSGLEVWVRDASIMDLMLTGKIPQTMLGLIAVEAEKSHGQIDLQKMAESNEFGTLVDNIVLLSVIEPPLAAKGDEQHLGLDELPASDKMAIFEFANREVESAKPFRDQPAQPVDAA